MRAFILIALALFSVVCYGQSSSFKLELMTEALSKGAACLDGTAPGYYFREGTGDGVNKWLLFHQGGGWCNSLSDCVSRSKTALGSSKSYAATANYNDGYFSISPSVNPLMYNWNVAYFQYCDGASFAGHNETVTVVNETKLYFRGFDNLQAYLAHLNANHQLQKGTDFMISGCSAGGLATYLHVDWWKENLPASGRVRGLPDSGFFLDYDSPNYPPKYGTYMRWVFQQQNVTSGVNQKCIASRKPTSDCMFAEHTVPYITTPIFPLQSRFDSWQIDNELGTKTDALVNGYGTTFDQRFQVVSSNPANGYFWDSCYHHCGSWNDIRINNQLCGAAIQDWFNGGASDRFFQQQNYPCTACCTP